MSNSGPAEVPAWVMRFNEIVERLYLVLRINLVWTLLSLLGLIVLGVAPASVAAADALIASRDGTQVKVLPTMWAGYRRHLVAANLRLLPLMAVQGGAAATLWLVGVGATPGAVATVGLGCLAAICAAWSTVSAAAIVATPRLRRQDALVTVRLALLIPGALPLRAAALVVVLLLWTMLGAALWPVAVLVGAATAIDVDVGLLRPRIERLLQDIDGTSSASG